MMIVRQGLGTRLHKRHNTVTHYYLIDVGEGGNSWDTRVTVRSNPRETLNQTSKPAAGVPV